MNKKIALISMVDENFIIAWKVFIKSLLDHNKWFNYPIILLCEKEFNNRENLNLFRQSYANVILETINEGSYKNTNFSKVNDPLYKTFYKLDIFRIIPFDRLVFIDLDVIIRDDISFLFNCTDLISGCKAYRRTIDDLQEWINSGVMVINKPIINLEVYKNILKTTAHPFTSPDQDAINYYFKDILTFLPKEYNVEKRMLHSSNYPAMVKDSKILHYVSQKPWQKDKTPHNRGFEEIEKWWWDAYNDIQKGIDNERV